jgi:hypothetical protein
MAVGGKLKHSPGCETDKPEQRSEAERKACSCAIDGTDRLLEAARSGWAVTIRYSFLMIITRWPALVCGVGGTGALGLTTSYARARGWI